MILGEKKLERWKCVVEKNRKGLIIQLKIPAKLFEKQVLFVYSENKPTNTYRKYLNSNNILSELLCALVTPSNNNLARLMLRKSLYL